MAAVLGGPNVYPLKSQTLSSPYNDWAQGHLLIFIEELRLVGHNRYDVLNSIKDNITNDVVEINPKFVNPYSAPNNSAYLATTNFKNALPINDNDRRYHILMSQWQEAAPLAAFLADHPDYFDNLYNAIEESAGAIRGWLETYELDPEFKRQGRAPFSHGHVQMAAINKSDEEVILSEIIADGHRQDISNELVVVSALIQELYGQGDLGLVNPPNRGYGPTIKLLLVGCGFNYLGRFRIDGKRESVWTKTPEKWSKNPEVAGRQIATRLKGDL